jgi:catechol 2,3-dioxygenase-like lactoylglutathione lyase family enzyme
MLLDHPHELPGLSSPAPMPPDDQHVAFAATSRAMVDAFYEAALRAGGSDNGPPGLRKHYHPNYHACFVIDPDGYRLEAVCHQPE